MIFALRECILQVKSQLLKRFVFYSATRNTESKLDNYILNPGDKVILRREGQKFLKFAILGLPNVGKSTLINRLTNRTVCPTSSKVHTTTHKAEAIYSDDTVQIVFTDTPGLVKNYEFKKYKLPITFKTDPVNSIAQADIVGIIQDVTNVRTRYKIDQFVIENLKNKKENAPLLLIFNKIDKLKGKHVLLELTRSLTNNENLPKFDDVFMISALNNDGVDDLRNYLFDSAQEQDWQYDDQEYIDQLPINIIKETVRAVLLDTLPQDIPYNIKLQVEHFDVDESGTVKTLVRLECVRKRYIAYLLSSHGHTLKIIASTTEKRLRHAFRTQVIVLLSVIDLRHTKN